MVAWSNVLAWLSPCWHGSMPLWVRRHASMASHRIKLSLFNSAAHRGRPGYTDRTCMGRRAEHGTPLQTSLLPTCHTGTSYFLLAVCTSYSPLALFFRKERPSPKYSCASSLVSMISHNDGKPHCQMPPAFSADPKPLLHHTGVPRWGGRRRPDTESTRCRGTFIPTSPYTQRHDPPRGAECASSCPLCPLELSRLGVPSCSPLSPKGTTGAEQGSLTQKQAHSLTHSLLLTYLLTHTFLLVLTQQSRSPATTHRSAYLKN